MIVYKNCIESNVDEIYSAFISGFSDYIVKLVMPMEAFEKRFSDLKAMNFTLLL